MNIASAVHSAHEAILTKFPNLGHQDKGLAVVTGTLLEIGNCLMRLRQIPPPGLRPARAELQHRGAASRHPRPEPDGPRRGAGCHYGQTKEEALRGTLRAEMTKAAQALVANASDDEEAQPRALFGLEP